MIKTAGSWIHKLRHEIDANPSKADAIRRTLADAWQAYAAQVTQQPDRAAVELSSNFSLVGAPVLVTAARDPRQVGLKGVCLWHNACHVHVLASNHPCGVARLTTLSKQSTAFSVEAPPALAARLGHHSVHHIGRLCSHTSPQAR